MKVKRRKYVYVDVDVEVFFVERKRPLKHRDLNALPCSLCNDEIGNRPWGLAWMKIDGEELAQRLCEDCLLEAEKEATL